MDSRSPFSQDPIVVAVGSHRVHVPHRNAAEWVDAMQRRNGPGGVLLELCRENTHDILKDALITGDVSAQDVVEASHRLIETAIPYRWWEATRLLVLSADTGVLGRTVLAGMDPWELTAAQWCAGVYAICTEHADEKGKFKFDAMLSNPPEGVDDDSWGEESFDAMVAQARRMPGMG